MNTPASSDRMEGNRMDLTEVTGCGVGDVLLAGESLAVSFGPTPALVDASMNALLVRPLK